MSRNSPGESSGGPFEVAGTACGKALWQEQHGTFMWLMKREQVWGTWCRRKG